MTSTSSARLRAAAGESVKSLLRTDQWPQRFGPLTVRVRDVLRFALRRARDARLAQVAGGLTFTTVLSIVPLLAVALSVFTAFPLFSDFRVSLEKDLLRGLLPEQYAPVILKYLNDFTSKAGRLTAVGLVFLVFTALATILTVDHALNDIWQVHSRRPLVQRVLLYWSLLTLGPLVIGASLSTASYVMSMSAGWTAQLPGMLRTLLAFTPFLLGVSAVAVTYVVVPNRKVFWRDACIGALVAAVMGELMRDGFAWYIKTGTVAGIYGAFAVLPLFLMWVYMSWLVVLFGAAIAATLPKLRASRFADEARAGNAFVTAVALLRTLHAARARGDDDGRVPLESLAQAVRSAPEDVERTLMSLEKLGYISQLSGVHAGKWLMSCDPARTNLVAAFKRFAVDPANTLATRDASGLGQWLDEGLRADWIARPLDEVMVVA